MPESGKKNKFAIETANCWLFGEHSNVFGGIITTAKIVTGAGKENSISGNAGVFKKGFGSR